MSTCFKKAVCLFAFLLLLIFPPLKAQILQDSLTLNLVKEDISFIYNLNFIRAHELYTKIAARYPDHPIVYLLKGLMTYWENYPMLSNSGSRSSMEEDLRQCIKISEKEVRPEYEAEYLLANLCARGLLLLYYDDNGLVMEVVPLTISTYKYLRHAFDLKSAAVDLNYFTGVYDYFREAYPKMYPVYKSLAFMFPHGDIANGLAQLQTAAKNSVVMKAESAILLIWIYLGYEDDPAESTLYARSLIEKYPDNPFFRAYCIRNLLVIKKYDEAEKLMSAMKNGGSGYYEPELMILKGILQEKKYNNINLACQYYKNGISGLTAYGKYGNEFAAYGYFGLSRISNENDVEKTRKTYRETAMKLADIKKINFDK
jgi:hypothetical protein